MRTGLAIRLPVFWYFPRGMQSRPAWSNRTRNGDRFGYTWTRLPTRNRYALSGWARLTVRVFWYSDEGGYGR